jgi:N-methylhydantoinase B
VSFEVNRRLVAPRPPLPTPAAVDPVTAGIVRGAFETICFEVATHLGRCASSAIINQSNERNAAVIDAHGRLAGLSVGIPQLLFLSPLTVRFGLENRDADAWAPATSWSATTPSTAAGTCPTTTSTRPSSTTAASCC